MCLSLSLTKTRENPVDLDAKIGYTSGDLFSLPANH